MVRLGYCFTPYQRLWLYNGFPLVAFYDTLGIRRTYSRLKLPASSRGYITLSAMRNEYTMREKGRDLTQSYDKSLYTHRKIQTAKCQHQTSIAQLLRTDLGRSVEATIATQLVWLTGLRDLNLPTNHNSRVIKRTHI